MGTASVVTFGRAPNSIGREIATQLRELAKPREHGEKVTVAINRVAHLCSFEYWRTFDLWYLKARRVEEHERAAVAAALAKKQREAARNEFHELRSRLAILESRLNQIDPDFHGPAIDAAWEQMRGPSGMARPGNRGGRGR